MCLNRSLVEEYHSWLTLKKWVPDCAAWGKSCERTSNKKRQKINLNFFFRTRTTTSSELRWASFSWMRYISKFKKSALSKFLLFQLFLIFWLRFFLLAPSLYRLRLFHGPFLASLFFVVLYEGCCPIDTRLSIVSLTRIRHFLLQCTDDFFSLRAFKLHALLLYQLLICYSIRHLLLRHLRLAQNCSIVTCSLLPGRQNRSCARHPSAARCRRRRRPAGNAQNGGGDHRQRSGKELCAENEGRHRTGEITWPPPVLVLRHRCSSVNF